MKYTPKSDEDGLYEALEPVVKGLGMRLIEAAAARHRGSCQVRVTVDKEGGVGTEDCARVHQAALPRLSLALDCRDLYLEVSSPGTDRLIKDGAEFAHFIGKPVRCYLTDKSAWTRGVLRAADETAITIEGKEGLLTAPYERIGKARLDPE